MSGWDTDDDLLDAVLDGNGGDDNSAGADASFDAGIATDEMDGAGEEEDLGLGEADGWGDGDLDLDLTSEGSDEIPAAAATNESTAPPPPAREKSAPPPPPAAAKQPPPPPAAAAASPPKSLVAMLSEHERMMDREISSIHDATDAKGGVAVANESADASDGQDEWDFEDDEDIFNEGNEGLDEVGGMGGLDAGEPEQQGLTENPFLREEPDANEMPVQLPSATANDEHEAAYDVEDAGDGWSDDDFFEDEALQASSVPPPPPQPAPVPPPPTPQPHAPAAVTAMSPPIAQRTRAQRAQLQTPSQARAPSPVPPLPAALNSSQRRIQQMLSSYVASLHDADFLGRLHQKLQRHQTAASGAHGDNGEQANSAAMDLKTYYAARPGLRKYTLGVEMDRMDYALVLANGRRTDDKDVIRSYFGVGEDGERMHPVGEEEAATTEELLVRSANQSLLADMLVSLTGAEDDLPTNGLSEDDFFDGGTDDAEYKERKVQTTGLILSGPTLCMTSVAEACNFILDLQSEKVEAVCDLAISVPFHGDASAVRPSNGGENVVQDGRLLLARARVSVRFRPGGEGGDHNDEPTVQYAVQSVHPLHAPDSTLLAQAAISLAHDQEDPFFHDEYAITEDEAADARDQFLLSHHLLSDSGLIAVSDHIDKLREAAEAGSTGFRSALQQLDGVTNVSGKLQFLKETAGGRGGSGLGGFGLALPSVEEIEAAEREAMAGAHVSPPPNAKFRFPRPEGHVEGRPPPPPPLPVSQQGESEASRPRPLIGGLFMSGLSRIAAAATQPETATGWEGGGGTGLTPPSSPPGACNTDLSGGERPVFYRRDEDIAAEPPRDEPHAPAAAQPQMDHLKYSTVMSPSPNKIGVSPRKIFVEQEDVLEESQDAGWSDDEFDFGDESGQIENDKGGECSKDAKMDSAGVPHSPHNRSVQVGADSGTLEPIESVGQSPAPRQIAKSSSIAIPPPALSPQRPQTTQPMRTFEEEFVLVLKEKIESETKEMEETGRMKRWTPIRDDPQMRRRLMDVMVAQINSN
ncbi:hypothetical protein ACHAXT_010835 [Thalassiosira profunda]